jgi:hypothetical protein
MEPTPQPETPPVEPRRGASETEAHRTLKRMSLAWAQERGFRIAAAEVSVPTLGRCRLDAAAYRPAFSQERDPLTNRRIKMPRLGITAVFECKVSRADFLRDARRETIITQRLARLYEQRSLYEASMPGYFPSLRKGESLFPEFDGYRYEEAGFAPYDEIQSEIVLLTRRLHAQTKFDKLLRWQAANLHYLVVEPGVAHPHELPPGWGLLLREESGLRIVTDATWQEAPDHHRWVLLLRIAMCGTRAVNRDLEVVLGLQP